MRIGDFARLANVSVRAVRFYDQTGLLPAIGVDAQSGYRHYAICQLEHLRQIRALQDLGFSLKEVRELLRANLPDSALRARMQQRKSEIQQQIRDDMHRIERIETYLRHAAARSYVHSAITLQEAKESWVVSLRAKLRHYGEADDLFLELERKVPAHLLSGQRSALWHCCESSGGPIDCEVVRYLKAPLSAPRGLNVYRSPAVKVASIFHRGNDDCIGDSYKALNEWLACSDFRLRGAKREVYWCDSSVEEAQCVTEIQFPLTLVSAKSRRAA